MPIYEYACPHCQKSFEEWLKSDDAAEEHPCPDCGQSARRMISNTTFILKGGGWYVTEYGHKDTDKSEPASSADAGADAKNADSAKDAAAQPASGGEGTTASAGKGEDKSLSAAPAASETPKPSAPTPAAPAKESKPTASAAQ